MSSLATLVSRGPPPQQSLLRRRCALDIGSGTMKFQIADVDTQHNTIFRNIFSDEAPVPFGLDWRENGGRLSANIMEEVCGPRINML